MQRGKTEAETIQLNGWVVGDILEGDEGYGPERIWITCVGEDHFFCRWDRKCDGQFGRESRNTTLSCREWKKVGHKPVVTTSDAPEIPDPVGIACRAEHPLLTQATFRKDEVPVGTPVYAQQPTRLMLSHQQLKAACTEFFYWWSNQPGSNTKQGFDAWFEEEGRRFLSLSEETEGTVMPEPVSIPESVREAIRQVRPQICNCAWNINDHAPDCPSGILQNALLKVDEVASEPVTLTYTNWKGDTRPRTIIPKGLRFGSTNWHPEPQWLLLALDTEKHALREFALKDFGGSVNQSSEPASPNQSNYLKHECGAELRGRFVDGEEVTCPGCQAQGIAFVDDGGTEFIWETESTGS